MNEWLNLKHNEMSQMVSKADCDGKAEMEWWKMPRAGIGIMLRFFLGWVQGTGKRLWGPESRQGMEAYFKSDRLKKLKFTETM